MSPKHRSVSPVKPASPDKGKGKNAAAANNAHHGGDEDEDDDEEGENKEVRLAAACFCNG